MKKKIFSSMAFIAFSILCIIGALWIGDLNRNFDLGVFADGHPLGKNIIASLQLGVPILVLMSSIILMILEKLSKWKILFFTASLCSLIIAALHIVPLIDNKYGCGLSCSIFIFLLFYCGFSFMIATMGLVFGLIFLGGGVTVLFEIGFFDVIWAVLFAIGDILMSTVKWFLSKEWVQNGIEKIVLFTLKIFAPKQARKFM